jgi:predicted alpha/beta superfamily hydrolase
LHRLILLFIYSGFKHENQKPFQAPESESRHVQYTRFFQEELFPLVESHYRVETRERLLFGFSSAGFFALHLLLTQPGMFRRHIAASCTWPGAGDYFVECAQRNAEGPAAYRSLPGGRQPG